MQVSHGARPLELCDVGYQRWYREGRPVQNFEPVNVDVISIDYVLVGFYPPP